MRSTQYRTTLGSGGIVVASFQTAAARAVPGRAASTCMYTCILTRPTATQINSALLVHISSSTEKHRIGMYIAVSCACLFACCVCACMCVFAATSHCPASSLARARSDDRRARAGASHARIVGTDSVCATAMPSSPTSSLSVIACCAMH